MSVDVYIRTGIQVTVSQTNRRIDVNSPNAGVSAAWVDTNYYPRDNPSGYATGIDGSLFVPRTESGQFYPANNPSGFSTGIDGSAYVPRSESGQFYPVTNPSGFLRPPNISNIHTIDFSGNDAVWQEGRVFYDSGSHALSYFNEVSDVTVNLGQEQLVKIRNGEVFPILNGKVVRISGSQGNHPLAYLADNTTGTSNLADTTIGVATHDITNDGYVTTFGLVHDINTQGITAGSTLFLSTGGTFTATEPTKPNHRVRVGYVLYEHSTQGIILVSLHIGACLREIHDVSISNPQSGQILTYNSSSSLWENKTFSTNQYVTTGETGSFVTTYQTGAFYASNNPSGFITGVNLTNYITTSQTGDFYAKNNPSGFITGVDLTNYVTKNQTGDFYPRNNPSGFITGLETGNLADKTYVQTTSGVLNDKLIATGSYLSTGSQQGFSVSVPIGVEGTGIVFPLVFPSTPRSVITTLEVTGNTLYGVAISNRGATGYTVLFSDVIGEADIILHTLAIL